MGRNKALLLLGGRPMLDRVRDAMTPVVRRVRVIGGAYPGASGSATAETPMELEPDVYPGLGPLSGIHAALATAKCDVVLVVACDLPFVTTEFLRGLVERLEPRFQAVVPIDRSGPIPVCALYRVTALAALDARFARGELSARDFVASLETRSVEGRELSELDPEGLCLWNVNTPADYDEARARGRF